MNGALRAALLLTTAAAGWFIADWFGLHDVTGSAVYAWLITALLGTGLYAAAYGIDLQEARTHLRTVILAVTVGVMAKVAVIATVMVVFFGDSRMILLAVAVAQIDPLSVAALRHRSKLSPAASSLLSAWASFDDPITVLLTAYLAAFVLQGEGDAGLGALDTGLLPFLANLGLNLLFAALAFVLWRAYESRWRARVPKTAVRRRWAVVAAVVVVLALATVAVSYALLLSLAFIGLFVRPRIASAIDRIATAALYAATFAIGMVVVVDRPTALAGIVLGAAAFFAQFLIALLLPARGLSAADRMGLAFAQQNGLTAIVLALLLEPLYPGAAGTIAFAVVVINVLHGVANAVRRAEDEPVRPVRLPRPEPRP
ncbi:hypothetical protein [Actinokineospora sp. UTMC 2448]|uniref:hypothetical protein n=1 Tax=Actinokineospora sp. UTMC 2448 TaxID=2268449 RepID=UPI002164417E|nr:hypothetical protein [Actinokineospora sp. UTMC 2448]UVS81213.1 hypothetical protein Actkin_04970 [Actinokineospora sp. UTMC 2448]